MTQPQKRSYTFSNGNLFRALGYPFYLFSNLEIITLIILSKYVYLKEVATRDS